MSRQCDILAELKMNKMNKRLLTFLGTALLIGSLTGFAGKTVPYSSEFYVDFNLDEGWQTLRGNRGNFWGKDRDSQPAQFEVAGVNNGACYAYHTEYAADAWLVSPAIDLKSGVEYTVGIWSRTIVTNYAETENFRINVAKEGTVSSLKAGTTIINKPDYSNPGDFEYISATFTPSEDGEYYFGIQCYSEEWMYNLYVTGFVVTDGSSSGGGETDPDKPDQPGEDSDVKNLPFSFDFKSQDIFNEEWTKVKGPESTNNKQWGYNTLGWATLDADDETAREDDWLISPAFNIEEAGTYAIDYRIWANGTMELRLGKDKEDLESFNQVVVSLSNNVIPSENSRAVIEITEPGTYYAGFRACSESCMYMDQRVYYFGIKSEKPVPAAIDDLVALADPTDGLSVSLSWTYPSKTNSGAELMSIERAELYRNGQLIKTFTEVIPGTTDAYEDELDEAGTYAYKLWVYNENGYDIDNADNEISAGYVGKPVVSYPYSYSTASLTQNEAGMFTIEDANKDGYTWNLEYSYYSNRFISRLADQSTDADDYLATPYIPVKAGYHKVNFTNGGQNQNYEMGYATNRHDLAGTFVKIDADSDGYTSDRHEYIISIENDGDYVFVIRHTGATQYTSYYNTLEVSAFSIEEAKKLPETAENLKVKGTLTNAEISWTNPSLDNAGLTLDEISHVDIYRNDTLLVSLTSEEGDYVTPGKNCIYTDDNIQDSGEFTYKVEVYNSNGKSVKDADTYTVFVGHGLEASIESSDFHNWKVINNNDDWYDWDYDYNDEYFEFSQSWSETDDYAMTPYIELIAGNEYQFDLTATTNTSDGYDLNFVISKDYMPESCVKVGEINLLKDEEIKTSYYFKAIDEAAPQTIDEPAYDEKAYYQIAAGNTTFGVHAYKNGHARLISYAVNKVITDGLQTIVASNGKINYSNGMVVTSSVAKSINVYSIDGSQLATTYNSDSISLKNLKGIIIVVAAIDGVSYSLKINL